MEQWLLDMRTYIKKECDLNVLKAKFHDHLESFMLCEDYELLFDDVKKITKEVESPALFNVLQFDDLFKTKLLLLVRINSSLIHQKKNFLPNLQQIYDTLGLERLVKLYAVEEVMYYLYELYLYPAYTEFLHVTRLLNLTIESVIACKSKKITLKNYWEHITDFFPRRVKWNTFTGNLPRTTICW